MWKYTEFKSEGFGGIHRSSARALWRLLPRPPYLFSSPDHFLMALKPGGLLCCCQTGHPTSCERQEGALLILQPQTQNLCSRNLQKNLCYCVTSHTVLVRLKQIHRIKQIKISPQRCISNLQGSQQLLLISLSFFWIGSPVLQRRQSRTSICWRAGGGGFGSCTDELHADQEFGCQCRVFFSSYKCAVRICEAGIKSPCTSKCANVQWQRSISATGHVLRTCDCLMKCNICCCFELKF